MNEESNRQSFVRLTRQITKRYFEDIVRLQSSEETILISRRNELRGFHGCVGSIDCCKFYWKNCPTSWAGQYRGRDGKPTVVMEAVVDDRRRFQHVFFGKPGTCNDINVFDWSPLRSDIIAGRWPRNSISRLVA
jgi:Plant transposon protein